MIFIISIGLVTSARSISGTGCAVLGRRILGTTQSCPAETALEASLLDQQLPVPDGTGK